MKLSRNAVTTAGIINANVTFRKVRHCDAPHIRLAYDGLELTVGESQ